MIPGLNPTEHLLKDHRVLVNQKLQAGFLIQTQGQVGISNGMKNMFLRQVRKEPIARVEAPVKLQEGLMEVVEGVLVLLQNLRQVAVQAVLQVHHAVQVEAQVYPEEAVVVHLLHQVDLHQENNLKNLL